MEWILIFKKQIIEENKLKITFLFSDILLNKTIIKVENTIDLNINNENLLSEIETHVINILNYNVAIKDPVYIIISHDDDFYFLQTCTKNIIKRVNDKLDFKTFYILTSTFNKQNLKKLILCV